MLKTIKKISAGLTAVMSLYALFVVSHTPVVNAESTAFNQNVKNGVCVVASYYTTSTGSSEEIAGWGTGFFVGEEGIAPQYLITNHHVVEDYLNHGSGSYNSNLINTTTGESARMGLRVYYDKNNYEEAYVVDYDENKDIAIVKLDSATDQKTPLTLNVPTDEMQGQTVYCVGYPGDADNITFEAVSQWGENDMTITTGVISRLTTLSNRGGEKAIQTDAEINHGNSGGPMVDQNGSVVGINSWGASPDDRQLYYAINIEEAIAMLNKNSVAYTIYSEKSSAISGTAIVVGVAVVVVVGGAVAFVMNKNKNQQGSSKKKSNGTKKAVIRSMSAQHNGKVFPVGKAPLTIGRDSSNCQIVYNQSTPGISGKHCTIYYDSSTGLFTLTDLNSSYGTFLSNGLKLNPHTPVSLKPNDSFYVGDKANVLKVELES